MANSWRATLEALSPDFYWPMDDDLADPWAGFADANGDADAIMDLVSPDTQQTYHDYAGPWNKAPSPFIWGTPRRYAFYSGNVTNQAVGTSVTGFYSGENVTTGCIGAWFHCYELPAAGGEMQIINCSHYAPSSGISNIGVRIMVDSNGSPNFRCDWQNSRYSRAQASNGTIEVGKSYFIVGVQDGVNGMRLFINGLEVAVTQSAGGSGITTNSYLDPIMTSSYWDVAGVALCGVSNGSTLGEIDQGCVVGEPFIFLNSFPSDAEIEALYLSANIGQTATDFTEWLMQFHGYPDEALDGSNDLLNAMPGYFISGRSVGITPLAGCYRNSGIGDGASGGDSIVNVLETNDAWVSPYDNFHQLFEDGANDVIIADNSSYRMWNSSSYLTGTILVAIKLNVFGDRTRAFYAFGPNDDNGIEFHIVSTASPPTFRVRVEGYEGSEASPTYRVYSNFLDPSLVPDDELLWVAIVQPGDGSGMRIYVNGVDETSSIAEIDTNPDIWMGNFAGNNVRIGGEIGSASVDSLGPHAVAYVMETVTPMSGAEVLEMWDAWNGVFPGEDSPPDGGFADTLGETGNETDPNGPGPWHWWRMNAEAAPILDIGIADVNGDSIAEGGDPEFQANGPLVLDPTNYAIYFDGNDYFEIGVDGVAGDLTTSTEGTVGFFAALAITGQEMIAYSQSDDTATEYAVWGINDEGYPFFYIQESASNWARYTASIAIEDLGDFMFAVITNDGNNYIWYINGVADDAAVLEVAGTFVGGEWTDSILATRSAIGARADASFTTETNGRFSEIFIYEEVLSASQIGSLFDAAARDGANQITAALGALVFEDCTFRNGGLADIRMVNPRTDFNLALQVNRSRFLGGFEGADVQSIYVEGAVNAVIDGSQFDLEATPTTGRAAIVASSADPTAEATIVGSLSVTNNELEGMGHADTDVRPAIFVESAFQFLAKHNQLTNSRGAGIGWRGDVSTVKVMANLIAGVASGPGILVQQGLSTGTGSKWQVNQNEIVGPDLSGIAINGFNSSGVERARYLQMVGNTIDGLADTVFGVYLNGVQDVAATRNEIRGGLYGFYLQDIANVITLMRNRLEAFQSAGVFLDESNIQNAYLAILANYFEGTLAESGVYVDGVNDLMVRGNTFDNLAQALTLGDVANVAHVSRNQAISVTTPIDIIDAAAIGELIIDEDGFAYSADVQPLTVATDAIDITTHYHTITIATAGDLATINGGVRNGFMLTLTLDSASENITVKDATGNINLASSADFEMVAANDDSLTLAYDLASAAWYEVSRVDGA